MRSVRLVQFTDTHVSGAPTADFRGVVPLQSLRAAVAHASARFTKPDGVLLTGDLVDEDAAGYRWIREIFAGSPVPVLCLPGNHDLPTDMHAALAAKPFHIGGATRFGR